jgi:hypothetical protein
VVETVVLNALPNKGTEFDKSFAHPWVAVPLVGHLQVCLAGKIFCNQDRVHAFISINNASAMALRDYNYQEQGTGR